MSVYNKKTINSLPNSAQFLEFRRPIYLWGALHTFYLISYNFTCRCFFKYPFPTFPALHLVRSSYNSHCFHIPHYLVLPSSFLASIFLSPFVVSRYARRALVLFVFSSKGGQGDWYSLDLILWPQHSCWGCESRIWLAPLKQYFIHILLNTFTFLKFT